MGGKSRLLGRVALTMAGLGALAIPALAVGLSGSAAADGLWTALRVGALEALTLLVANIVTGSFRPWFNKLFRPRAVHRFHQVTGITGFALAVAHGLMVLVFGTAGYQTGAWVMGPVALALLAAAIAAAILRARLRRAWRWIHRLNYVIFFVVLAHGLILGADLSREPLLQICFGVYAAVVLAGIAYRLRPRRRPTPTRR